MKQDKFINKDDISEYHLDINELYREGIELIQKYSGDKWSDYNEHDPGVTILENLVFAITDVCFRLGFDAIDFLVSEDGTLDEQKQALYRAPRVLTSHPVTIEDFRKVIFDNVKEASNVWVEPKRNGLPGIYSIVLFARPNVHFQTKGTAHWNKVKNEIRNKVVGLWPSIRNFGEDLDDDSIQVLTRQNIYVKSSLVLKSINSLEDVLAQIIYEVDNYFNPELIRKSLEDLIEEGYAVDEVFDGPLLENGFVDKESLLIERPVRITKARLVSIISNIKGIDQIENLTMHWEEGEEMKESDTEVTVLLGRIPRFHFERETSDKGVKTQRLIKEDRTTFLIVKLRRKNHAEYLDVDYEKMIKKLRKMQAMRNRSYDLDLSHTLANDDSYRGSYRDFGHYTTIQNELPYIYAINNFGTSKFDSNERKSAALQLKAYLILFEQLLANFAAQVQNLKKLYSPFHLDKTYFSAPLTQSDIEGIEKLYVLDNLKDDVDLLHLTGQ